MKITDVTTYIVGNPWKNWVFTRVDTDEGIHGIGEATLNGFAKTVEAAIQRVLQNSKNLHSGIETLRRWRRSI